MFRRRRPADDDTPDFEFEVAPVAKPTPLARRRRLRPLRIFLLTVCLTALALLSSLVGFTTAVQQARPSISQFTQTQPGEVGYIYAKKRACPNPKRCQWVVIGELRSADARDFVSGAKIAENMKHAIVAIEDRRFYQHKGVDPVGILRAVFSKLQSGSSEGASTIDQQLIKREYLKDSAQTYTRKLREALLAPQLEKQYTKEQILTQYLNGIYYGNGAYGVEDASQLYFGHAASKLDIADAALLAAIAKSPTDFDPYKHVAAATERRSIVIDKMVQQGYATAEQGAAAKQERLVAPKHARQSVRVHGNEGLFVLAVEQQLVRRYGAAKTYGGGLRVYTSLELDQQATARKTLKQHLKNVGPDGALVSIAAPTGEVTAAVGDWTWPDKRGKEVPQQYSLATDARRQPGSSFKPFDLLAAGEKGIQTNSTFVSHPVVFDLGAGAAPWSVHNAEHTAGGSMTLRTALAESDNTVFAQLTMTIGPDSIAKAAHAAGINSMIDSGVPAIGIGGLSQGVTPLEMAHAYATIDNGGMRIGGSVLWHTVDSGITDPTVDPIMIEKVTAGGKVVDDNTPAGVRAFPAANALSVLQAMRGVMTGAGTGTKANLAGREVAGKTGTTEAYRDAWFIGMVPQRVTSVWVGYPKGYISMATEYHGTPVFGGTYPAMIFHDFMTSVLRGVPAKGWPSPPYVPSSSVYLDPRTWYRAPTGCRYGRSLVLSNQAIANLKGVYRCPANLRPIPTVVGWTRAKAVNWMRDQAGVYTKVIYVPATTGDQPGTVVSQDPAALTQLPPRARVTLAVATKSAQVFVPQIEGLNVSTAVSRLQAVGLHAIIVQMPGRKHRGTVATWSVSGPNAGDTLASANGTRQVPSGSTIELKVPGRVSVVSIPDLSGFTVAQAEQTLGGLGLIIRARTSGGTSDPSDVISQSTPVSGSEVLAGQIVDVSASPKK